MSETKLSIELFKKVRDRIATIPESYDQSDWIRTSYRSPCGAAACLAGEAIICAAPTIEDGVAELLKLRDTVDSNAVIPARAAELLGLQGSWDLYCDTQDERDGNETLIFDPDGRFWPKDLRQEFREGEEADAALELLDRIIATGKVPVNY